jgi:hypothetical protein
MTSLFSREEHQDLINCITEAYAANPVWTMPDIPCHLNDQYNKTIASIQSGTFPIENHEVGPVRGS